MHDSEAAEIEAINEQIRQTCDKLITGNGLLSSFSYDYLLINGNFDLFLSIYCGFRKYALKYCYSEHQDLRNNSMITLMKFMLVSSSFCQKNLKVN